MVVEDFQYIGGLQNKKEAVHSSYSSALKKLNLMFRSLAEANNFEGEINVFVNDNLLTESIVEETEVVEEVEEFVEEEIESTDEGEEASQMNLDIPVEKEEILVKTKLSMPSRKLKVKISSELLQELDKMQVSFKLN